MYATANRSLEVMFRDRVNRLRIRASGIVCDLVVDDLTALYRSQNGLCFYTDVPMEIQKGNGKNRHSVSIDKIVPDLGYIRGNVVLCTYRSNAIKRDITLDEMREWMPSWHRRVIEFLRQHSEIAA